MYIQELFKPFEEALENPGKEAREWKKRENGGVIGFLMSDVPEEIIHAAGFFPFAIVSSSGNLDNADTHLQAWACSHVRNGLALASGKNLDFLDGLIIPHTCDTTRMLLDLWKHVQPLPYMEEFRLPRQVNRPSAANYLEGELDRIIGGLEEFSGKTLEKKSLINSIELYNKNRGLLRRIAEIHHQYPDLIGSRNFYTLVNGSMIMPREKVRDLLGAIVSSLEKKLAGEETADHIRIVLSGTLLEPMEILDYIEEFGGVVVGDDFQNGYRYFETDVNIENGIIKALASRQLKRIPSAAFDITSRPRRYFLSDLARAKKARGVIFVHLKFCEPENYDFYDNLQAMQEAGIPATRIDTQFGRTGLGQLRTRVHAFMEMVGGDGK